MFGFRLSKGSEVRTFMPNQSLGYTYVDTDGSQFDTVKIGEYYFPVDDDHTISDGYNPSTGEKVYVYDMHTNSRAEVMAEFCNLTYRYVLEHRMPKGVTVTKFIVEPVAL